MITDGQKTKRFVRMLNATYSGRAGIMPDETVVDRNEKPEAQPVEDYVKTEQFRKYLPFMFQNRQ